MAEAQLLSNKEIIEHFVESFGCLKEDITEAITKPTPDAVRRVYESYLEAVCKTKRDHLDPDFRCCSGLKHMEHHDEDIAIIELLADIKSQMRGLGIMDFTMKDLCVPTKKRLRKHLSAAINFSKFVEWKEAVERDTELQIQQSIDTSIDYSHQLAIKQAELEHVRATVAENAQAMEEARARKLASEVQVHAGGAAASREAQVVTQLSERLAHLKQQLESGQIVYEDLENRTQERRNRIIESPENMLREIEEMKETIRQTDEGVIKELLAADALTEHKWFLTKMKKEILEFWHRDMAEMAAERAMKKEAAQVMKGKQALCTKGKEVLDNLNQKCVEMEQERNTLLEDTARIASLLSAQKESLQSTLEMLHAETSKYELMKEMLNATERDARAEVTMICDQREVYKAKTRQAVAKCQQLMDFVRAERERFETALKPVDNRMLASVTQSLGKGYMPTTQGVNV